MDKLNPLELKFGGNVDLEKRVEVFFLYEFEVKKVDEMN
jgi:hypothetical protein